MPSSMEIYEVNPIEKNQDHFKVLKTISVISFLISVTSVGISIHLILKEETSPYTQDGEIAMKLINAEKFLQEINDTSATQKKKIISLEKDLTRLSERIQMNENNISNVKQNIEIEIASLKNVTLALAQDSMLQWDALNRQNNTVSSAREYEALLQSKFDVLAQSVAVQFRNISNNITASIQSNKDSVKLLEQELRSADENIRENINRTKEDIQTHGDTLTLLESETSSLRYDTENLSVAVATNNQSIILLRHSYVEENNKLRNKLEDVANRIRNISSNISVSIQSNKDAVELLQQEVSNISEIAQENEETNEKFTQELADVKNLTLSFAQELTSADENIRENINRTKEDIKIHGDTLTLLESETSSLRYDIENLSVAVATNNQSIILLRYSHGEENGKLRHELEDVANRIRNISSNISASIQSNKDAVELLEQEVSNLSGIAQDNEETNEKFTQELADVKNLTLSFAQELRSADESIRENINRTKEDVQTHGDTLTLLESEASSLRYDIKNLSVAVATNNQSIILLRHAHGEANGKLRNELEDVANRIRNISSNFSASIQSNKDAVELLEQEVSNLSEIAQDNEETNEKFTQELADVKNSTLSFAQEFRSADEIIRENINTTKEDVQMHGKTLTLLENESSSLRYDIDQLSVAVATNNQSIFLVRHTYGEESRNLQNELEVVELQLQNFTDHLRNEVSYNTKHSDSLQMSFTILEENLNEDVNSLKRVLEFTQTNVTDVENSVTLLQQQVETQSSTLEGFSKTDKTINSSLTKLEEDITSVNRNYQELSEALASVDNLLEEDAIHIQAAIFRLEAEHNLWHSGHNGYEYQITVILGSWQSGRSSCALFSADLAYIGIRDANTRLLLTRTLLASISSVWIGLSDRDREGNWKWIDGTTATSEQIQWNSGEPSNSGYGKDCGTILKGIGEFKTYDSYCTSHRISLCERKLTT